MIIIFTSISYISSFYLCSEAPGVTGATYSSLDTDFTLQHADDRVDETRFSHCNLSMEKDP